MAKDKKPTETQDNQSETTKTKTPKGGFKAVIKKLVTNGKKRGFITYDEINNALPTEEFSSEQIEDAMSAISEMGIQMVEKEDVKQEKND